MKTPRFLLLSRLSIPCLILISSLVFFSIPGGLAAEAITLRSIRIYNTHEFLAGHPSIYFHCKGEKKIPLPDVKEKDSLYTFKGQESWQPLTELGSKKCKRCGLYESDKLNADDVFDEWELCRDDFVDGVYVHYKKKEFNATLQCEKCKASSTAAAQTPKASHRSANGNDESANNRTNVNLVIVISVLASIAGTTAIISIYKLWQKKKRERDQAQFLKLFEESDDIEEELGLDL